MKIRALIVLKQLPELKSYLIITKINNFINFVLIYTEII